MPLGFTGFPRDPVSGRPTGIAQSFIKDNKEKKDTSTDTISSWKDREAVLESRQSVDTLPQYSEKDSSTSTREKDGTRMCRPNSGRLSGLRYGVQAVLFRSGEYGAYRREKEEKDKADRKESLRRLVDDPALYGHPGAVRMR